jgi:threonylcarbamoyladenosine tRNA methylthiotransferase MtaB
MNVYFDMVGCRLNQAEIDQLALDFVARGHQVVSEAQLADFIIVNTCCVTQKAAADSRKMIRHYQHSSSKVIATGCWATVNPAEAEQLVGLEGVFPNGQKARLAEFLPSQSQARLLHSELPPERPDLGQRHRTRGFLKVQDGCDNHCSYCLTRTARGASRSIPIKDIIAQARQYQQLGVQEIILSGVQLGSFGRDLEDRASLADLLRKLLEATEIPRLRLSSIEPWDVTDELLSLWEDPRLCRHLHMPLQSGSDRILREMRRPITVDKFSRLMNAIQSCLPGVSVTTDLIVGFPGETDSDVEATRELIEQLRFSGGHVFRFSAMAGTPAAVMPLQVAEAVKHQRSRIFIDLFNKAKIDFARSKLGSPLQVLFEQEEAGAGSQNVFSGYSGEYIRVSASSEVNLVNQTVSVDAEAVDSQGQISGIVVAAQSQKRIPFQAAKSP